MKITHKDLEKYTEELFIGIGNILSADNAAAIKKNFEDSYKNADPKNMSQCIEKFIQTELDYETHGNRGIGRLTDTMPRLGAYFRNSFSELDEVSQNELGILITKLIAKGYIFIPMSNSKPKEKTLSFTSDELYKEWIPQIYTFKLTVLSENVWNLLLTITEKDFENIKNFFNKHNMKGGGLFSKDKTDDILNSYLIAGVALYFIENLKTS
jgi:hypothetical protein